MENVLHEILDDTTPVKTVGNKSTLVEFFEHPLIDSLFPGEYAPSFVSNIPIIGRLWAALKGYPTAGRLLIFPRRTSQVRCSTSSRHHR